MKTQKSCLNRLICLHKQLIEKAASLLQTTADAGDIRIVRSEKAKFKQQKNDCIQRYSRLCHLSSHHSVRMITNLLSPISLSILLDLNPSPF